MVYKLVLVLSLAEKPVTASDLWIPFADKVFHLKIQCNSVVPFLNELVPKHSDIYESLLFKIQSNIYLMGPTATTAYQNIQKGKNMVHHILRFVIRVIPFTRSLHVCFLYDNHSFFNVTSSKSCNFENYMLRCSKHEG